MAGVLLLPPQDASQPTDSNELMKFRVHQLTSDLAAAQARINELEQQTLETGEWHGYPERSPRLYAAEFR